MTGAHGDRAGRACGAHAGPGAEGLGADLRGTALHLLERVRTVVEPLREQAGHAPDPGSPGACQACPVCALVAVLRGERSELATQLAEHATGLVAVLTAVLEADGAEPGTNGRDPGAGPRPPARKVQRIAVQRR